MGERLWCARRGLLAVVALAAMVWAAGCGSSSGGPGEGVAAGTRLVGTVEAPATQVARAGALEGVLARAFVVGSPAEAAAPVNRRPVAGATVEVSLLGQGQTLARTTTGRSGGFQMTINAPSGSVVLVTVNARGMGDRPIRLRACVQVTGASQTAVTVNEATTVGAEAAEAALTETGDAEAAQDAANTVTDAQEAAEEQNPAEVPDLSDTEPAREQVRERAHNHLVAHLPAKLAAVVGNGTPVGLRQARQAVMAAQVYARVILGLPAPIRLSRAQVTALAGLMASANAPTFGVSELAEKLEAAGVTIPVEGTLTPAAVVSAALDALRARPRLQPVIGEVTDEAVPALVALLLAEQANDPSVAFHITTQDQLNRYINGLVGAEVPGPGMPGHQGPGTPAPTGA